MTLKPTWKDDVQINLADLERELVEQPGLFAYYAELAAKTQYNYRVAKEYLQTLEAQITQEVMDRYQHAGKKATIKQIESEVATDPRVKAQKEQLSHLKLQVDLTKVAVDSFNHRLQSLIALVKMRNTEYYSTDIRDMSAINIDDAVRQVHKPFVKDNHT